MPKLKRLLITGAGGNLGKVCRNGLTHLAEHIVLSDRPGTDLEPAASHEEIVTCDLGDKLAVEALVDGCDGIVHMGGQSTEGTWDVVRNANIDGVFHLYEAARKSSVTPRIVFASSNHAIGFYKQSERLDAKATPRPDGLYGVSKVFGEAMASMYHDKFGIETASVRIGSCFPEPANHRMLATWMSAEDFIRLIERIFTVPRLGCPVIYGASANAESWWDNREVAYIGWQPQDNAEMFRAAMDARMAPPPKDDATALYQGGAFCADGIHED